MDLQGRNDWLSLDDEALAKQCRIDTCRGTGPGGQKRNKTSSMVRLLHLPSGILSENDETRSQHLNRIYAIRNLRMKLALGVRLPAENGPIGEPPGVNADSYALWLARILDALEAVGYRLSDAAPVTGLGTGRLVKEFAKIPSVWQFVNARRTAFELPPLRMPH